MPVLELQQPFETTEPRLRVENVLLPGAHRFRLIVVGTNGVESDPVDTVVTVVEGVPRSPPKTIMGEDFRARAREGRGRVFWATGVLLGDRPAEAELSDDRAWRARVLAYLLGSGTLAGLEVTWEKPTGGRSERLVVKPGLALDRLGRIIEVPRDVALRLDRWFEGQSDAELIGGFKPSLRGVAADAFVRFVPSERNRQAGLGTGAFEVVNGGHRARVGNGYELRLYLRQEPDPPPLPAAPWPVFRRTDGARKDLQDAIFAAWHEGDDAWDQGDPQPLAEHVPGQDPTSVFLARLILPATLPGRGGRPVRTGADVAVDNRSRRFAYPPAALARWVGL